MMFVMQLQKSQTEADELQDELSQVEEEISRQDQELQQVQDQLQRMNPRDPHYVSSSHHLPDKNKKPTNCCGQAICARRH